MIIDRISYKKVFPIGNFATEHIGLEGSLTETDNPETELNHLKTMVEELHKATMAEMESYRGTSIKFIEQETQVNKVPDEIQNAIFDIERCVTLDELKGFWLVCKSNLTLSTAYKTKEKQLTDAK